MPIPKQIFQTFKSEKLPWITRMHIKSMLKKNPGYEDHFYDDEKMKNFWVESFHRSI